MEIIFEDAEQKKFVSQDGDEMKIFFGENGEPDSMLVCLVEKHRVAKIFPELFGKLRSFDIVDYYEEKVRLFPECKNSEMLSEKQIQDLLVENCGDFVIDGREGVLLAEEYFGVKISEDYKLPYGLSPRQFHLRLFFDLGCARMLRRFDEKKRSGAAYAAMWAWQNLHFKNYDEADWLAQLNTVWTELVILNPELASLEINRYYSSVLEDAICGVMYGFPKADIKLWCCEKEKRNPCISKIHRERIEREMAENGLPNVNMLWLVSTETIVELGKKYRAKNQA